MGKRSLESLKSLVERLGCWRSKVEPEYLTGGRTNVNFVVEDAGLKYVVRVGSDIPEHMIMRFNELSATRAAERVGISPPVMYSDHGVLVMRFIEGKTLSEEDIQKREVLEQIVPLLRSCHRDMRRELYGPVLAFWVFHVIDSYAQRLHTAGVGVGGDMTRLLNISNRLEKAVGPTSITFTHNDLLAANFIDDGDRLWLIDWDYGGLGSPMFDLGGLSSNNGLCENDEVWLLEEYFEQSVTEQLWYRFKAMKCASLLRESLWSMVSEIHSELDVDYDSYTKENLRRFERSWDEFCKLGSGFGG